MKPMKTVYSKVSFDQLKQGQKIAARIVAECGEIYLPIFEKITIEIEKFPQQRDYKLLALSLFNEYNSK
jgi:hypothetical protein